MGTVWPLKSSPNYTRRDGFRRTRAAGAGDQLTTSRPPRLRLPPVFGPAAEALALPKRQHPGVRRSPLPIPPGMRVQLANACQRLAITRNSAGRMGGDKSAASGPRWRPTSLDGLKIIRVLR